MRNLIGALCAVAILVGAVPGGAAAATVGCGRVTTFVAPNSPGALLNSDGWVIFAKPDGTSDKVIIRAGTQIGTLAGYICIGIDSLYFTGLVAPGTAGYIAEPLEWLPADTVVYCGTVAANSITFGQGSGPRTYELRVTSGPAGGRGPFSVPDSIPLPALESYLCGRFARGVPMMGLLAVLRAGEPGYVAAGLPNTGTSVPAGPSLPMLGVLGAALLAILGLLVFKAKADPDVVPLHAVSLATRLRGFAAATALAVAATSCAPAASTGPIQTARPTAANTAAATFSVPATFAVACGATSDGVARTTTANATFLLNSPGRSPLKIASTGNAPIDAMVPSGYVCLLLEAGTPFPIFAGLIGPQMPGYLVEGTIPATSARPSPTGFVLPQACAFVAPPVVGTDTTVWAVDCGAQANRDARGTLGPALTREGWTSCSAGLATMSAMKNGVMLSVQESTLAPGDYPRLTQFARVISPCS